MEDPIVGKDERDKSEVRIHANEVFVRFYNAKRNIECVVPTDHFMDMWVDIRDYDMDDDESFIYTDTENQTRVAIHLKEERQDGKDNDIVKAYVYLYEVDISPEFAAIDKALVMGTEELIREDDLPEIEGD